MKDILDKINRFRFNELQVLEEYKNSGGEIAGLFNRLFPISLLYGLGIRPIRIVSGASLNAEYAGEKLVRPDACPFCKSILGNLLNKSSFCKYLSLIVGVIGCDQMRRTLERGAVDIGLKMFPIQFPSTISKETKEYYISGVNDTVYNIASHYKRELDYNMIRKSEQARVEAALILKELFNICDTNPMILHKLSTLFAWTRPIEYLVFLKQIREELPLFKPEKKVIITGSILCEEDDVIIKLFTEHRIFPIMLTSNGLNAFEGLESINDIPDNKIVSKLAEITFNMPASIRSRPNTKVYERLNRYILSSESSGVILKALQFCDLWYTEKVRMKQTLNKPVLVLNTGYQEGIQGSTATRIEAFIETLE